MTCSIVNFPFILLVNTINCYIAMSMIMIQDTISTVQCQFLQTTNRISPAYDIY